MLQKCLTTTLLAVVLVLHKTMKETIDMMGIAIVLAIVIEMIIPFNFW